MCLFVFLYAAQNWNTKANRLGLGADSMSPSIAMQHTSGYNNISDINQSEQLLEDTNDSSPSIMALDEEEEEEENVDNLVSTYTIL